MAAYGRAVLQHLPKGKIWNLSHGTVFYKMALAIADSFALIDERWTNLRERDMYPNRAVDTLDEYEQLVGIQTNTGLPLATRQANVVARLTAEGDNATSKLQALLSSLGYGSATIRDLPDPSVCGTFMCGSYLFGNGAAFVVEIEFTSLSASQDQAMMRTVLNWLRSHGYAVFRRSGQPTYSWETVPSGVYTVHGDGFNNTIPVAP